MQLTRRERIRAVFLHPADSYCLPYAARLTETPIRSLRREVAANRRDATKVSGKWRFTWRQLAYLAMERWTLAEIHDALGMDAGAALPPLLALRAVTVRLPIYIVRALEMVAAENETTLEHAIHGELIDFAGTMVDRVEPAVPGYRSAYLFPGRE